MKHFNNNFRLNHQTSLLILLVTVLAVVLSSCVQTPVTNNANGDEPYELVNIEWEEVIQPGITLALDNRWGDISLRQTGGDAAALKAVMQKIGEHPKTGALKVERSEGRIHLRFDYPVDQIPQSVREGRVDVALVVPAGVDLEVMADRGRVSSKTMQNKIRVRAIDQRVSLKTASSVDITSQAGDVDIQFVPRAEDDHGSPRGEVRTLQGEINISYYPEMAMRFEMLSGRPKTTNDPVLLQNRELTGRHVNMHTGENPEKMILQSDTGHIRLINTGSEILLNSPD